MKVPFTPLWVVEDSGKHAWNAKGFGQGAPMDEK